MDSSDFDYYRELEVDREATPPVIKAAYNVLARLHHTDTNPGVDDARIKRINVAWSCLRDPEKRRDYDLELESAAGTARNSRSGGGSQTNSEGGAGPRSNGGNASSGGKTGARGGSLKCEKCGRTFKSPKGLDWHRANFAWCASSPRR